MPGTPPPPLSQNPDDQQNSQDLAALLLRAKNIKEFKSVQTLAGTLVFPNGIAIESGACVNFINKGLFNGKWIIQKVTMHITENKFITEIEFRKCYDASKATTKNIQYVTNPITANDANQDPDPDPTAEDLADFEAGK